MLLYEFKIIDVLKFLVEVIIIGVCIVDVLFSSIKIDGVYGVIWSVVVYWVI